MQGSATQYFIMLAMETKLSCTILHVWFRSAFFLTSNRGASTLCVEGARVIDRGGSRRAKNAKKRAQRVRNDARYLVADEQCRFVSTRIRVQVIHRSRYDVICMSITSRPIVLL